MSYEHSSSNEAMRIVQMNAANLTTMINIAAAGKDTDKILAGIFQAVSYHFDLEEKTLIALGFNIPKEHLNEHKRMIKEIQQQERDWRANKINGVLFAESLQAKIFFHNSLYDKPLATHFQGQM